MPYFARAHYVFAQIAVREEGRTTNNNGGLQSCSCAYNSGEFLLQNVDLVQRYRDQSSVMSVLVPLSLSPFLFVLLCRRTSVCTGVWRLLRTAPTVCHYTPDYLVYMPW